jgi:sodium/potassium-transporting ATPase subunit alpha
MKINELTREEVFKSLVTAESGLAPDEAGRRLLEFGRNEIAAPKRAGLASKLLGQFTHFLAILLWIAAALAFLSEYFNPGEGMLVLGLAVVAVIFINAAFTFIQEYRAEKALEALKKLLPFRVAVIRGNAEREIAADEIVPGDMIRLSEGDKAPADMRILESNGLRVNNASLTGESEPVPRRIEPFPGDPINSPNIVFAGTSVVSGSGAGVAYATGARTEFGRIAQLTGAVTPGLTPLQKEIAKLTRIVAAIATIMGVVFFAVGFFAGRSFWENFLFAVGIIVANVPEGLLPTVTLALAMGSQRMAKRQALIKTLTSVETLGSVSVICTDKTGTLTENSMTVARLWVDDELMEPGPSSSTTLRLLHTTAALCNNARFVDNEYRGDPTETALLRAAREAVGDVAAKRLFEVPFDSDRKMMTTVHDGEQGTRAFAKGAMERILPLCSRIMMNGERLPLDEDRRNDVVHADHALMDMGFRVLAFAFRELPDCAAFDRESALSADVERDMTFLGLMGLQDPPRPEVPDAIRKCHDAGIRIIMITGDGSRTALAVARQIGLVRGSPLVIEGQDFGLMSDRVLREKLASPEVLFSRMTPKHKMRVVTLLKEGGEVVAVTGDGVNDAPALKRADIGIAMGLTGTDVAKEAADMILLDDNFATIVNAVEEGRAVYDNIRKFISYIFSSNIPEIVPYLAFILFRIPLPLTIMQILAVDLGTDMLPALALGAEKPSPGLMRMKPRKPAERLLSLPLLSRSYFLLGPIEAAACLFGFFWVLYRGGWSWGASLALADPLYVQATTACLTAIVVTQVANAFACRSFRDSLFTIGVFTNRLIFAGIAVELLLQLFIVYHPLGNALFATAPLPWSLWLAFVPFALLLLFAEEARKYLVRRTAPV